MLDLVIPRSGVDRYFVFQNWLLGPSWKGQFSGDIIPMPHFGRMVERKGFGYHENDVVHDKISGSLYWMPGAGGIIPDPTVTYPIYPDRVRLVAPRDLSGNLRSPTNPVYATNGVCLSRAYSRYDTSATNFYHAGCFRNGVDGSLFTTYHFFGNAPDRPTGAFRYSITLVLQEGTKYRVFYTRTVYRILDLPRSTEYMGYLGLDRLQSICATMSVAGTTSTFTLVDAWKLQDIPLEMSVQSISDHIDAITEQILEEEFPLQEIHYGVLAGRAIDKQLAIRSNMLEFVRDLRHIKDLAPKLSSFAAFIRATPWKKVKQLSSEYLRLHYGVQPTLRDLKEIVRGARRASPHIDRHGLELHLAMEEQAVFVGDDYYSLVQHIKLGVDAEDSGLRKIIADLDSFGLFPTTERLWDLVKYSFVVDWFVDVGGFLERVDSGLRIMRKDIRFATMSRKRVVEKTLNHVFDPLHAYQGRVKWTHYERWVKPKAPVPPLIPDPPDDQFQHWLEASALLIQRQRS